MMSRAESKISNTINHHIDGSYPRAALPRRWDCCRLFGLLYDTMMMGERGDGRLAMPAPALAKNNSSSGLDGATQASFGRLIQRKTP